MRGCPLVPPVRPTAQMSVAEVAVTADRLVVPPPGSPVCPTVQLVPFQCSIRVWVVLLCEVRPTAHTLPADTAATAVSTLASPLCPAFGLGTIVQPEPS